MHPIYDPSSLTSLSPLLESNIQHKHTHTHTRIQHTYIRRGVDTVHAHVKLHIHTYTRTIRRNTYTRTHVAIRRYYRNLELNFIIYNI